MASFVAEDRISINNELASLFKQYQQSDNLPTPANTSSNPHVVINIESNSHPAPPSAHIPPPPPPPPAPAPPQQRENVIDTIRKVYVVISAIYLSSIE